jgi:hypothetical protein
MVEKIEKVRGEKVNKRQSYREYATSAFRFLAREGSKEKYIKKLVDDLRRSVRNAGVSSPTESALIHKEQVLRDKAAELYDLEAAEKVMYFSEKEIRQSIEMVYMKDCWKELEKGDIETRVHFAEIHIPASRAAIYKWLARARRDFARERGLRV